MITILTSLVPRIEGAGTILLNELDHITEVLFFCKGQVDIGFELNRKRIYKIRRIDNVIIGDQGCCFN